MKILSPLQRALCGTLALAVTSQALGVAPGNGYVRVDYALDSNSPWYANAAYDGSAGDGIRVNGTRVPVQWVPLSFNAPVHPKFGRWEGTFPASDLKVGNNAVSIDWRMDDVADANLPNGSSRPTPTQIFIPGGWATVRLTVGTEASKGSPSLPAIDVPSIGPVFDLQRSYRGEASLTYAELNPEGAAHLATLEREIAKGTARLPSLLDAYKQKEAAYRALETCLAAFLAGTLDGQLATTEGCGRADLASAIKDAKSDLKTLRDAIETERASMRADFERAIAFARKELEDFGVVVGRTESDLVSLLPVSTRVASDMPPLPEAVRDVLDTKALLERAETTRGTLQGYGEAGDLPAFLEEMEAWTGHLDAITALCGALGSDGDVLLLDVVKARDLVAKTIETFVDTYGFLKASSVPRDLKQAVTGPLERLSSKDARALKVALSTWKGDALTAEQQHVVATLTVLGRLVRDSAVLGFEGAAKLNKTFVSLMRGGVEAALALGRTGASLSPAGDFIDLCEVVTGKEHCLPGLKELTLTERVLTAGGLLVGSGALWRELEKSPVSTAVQKGLGDVVALLAREVKDFPEIVGSLRKVDQVVGLPASVVNSFKGGKFETYETTTPIRLVRVWGEHPAGAMPTRGAAEIGGYWMSKIFPTEDSFRASAVTFKEWNAATRMTIIRVEPGTKMIVGRIGAQTLESKDAADGLRKVIPDSSEYQYLFPVENGMSPSEWVGELQRRGKIVIEKSGLETGYGATK